MRYGSLVMLFAAVLTGLAGAAEPVFELPMKPESAALWQISDPAAAALEFIPDGGTSGHALRLRIKKTAPGIIRIEGPEFPLKKYPDVVQRALRLELQAQAEEFGSAKLQFVLELPGGKTARPRSVRRVNQAVIDIVNGNEYSSWRLIDNNGLIDGDTGSARLVLLLETGHQAGGTFSFDRLAVTDEPVYAHRITTGTVFNHVYADAGTLTVNWHRPGELVRGKVTLRNEEDEVLETRDAAGGTAATVIPLAKRGFYAVRAEGEYRDGSRLVSDNTAIVVGALLPEESRLHSRFGVMRVWSNPDWGSKMGSRQDWGFWDLDNIEPGPDGRLRLKKEPVKPAVPSPFVRHLAMSGAFPPWLRSPEADKGQFMPPNDWNRLGEAVELWAKSLPDLPELICPYNEPDSHWRGSREELVKFHNVVTDAIKRARPEAKVGGPVICRIDIPRLKPFVDLGILRNMDAVVMHAYVDATAPEFEFYRNIVALQEYLATTPYAGLPLYLTEFGWTGPPGDWQKPVDELTKARYAVRSMLLCAVRGIDRAIYFCGKWSRQVDRPGYSIVTLENMPLPAAASLARFFREMADVSKGGKFFEVAPGVYCALFLRRGRALGVYWTQQGRNELQLPAQPVSVTGMTGRDLPAAERIAVSPSPVYVEFPDSAPFELTVAPERTALSGRRIELPPGEAILPPFTARKAGEVLFADNAPTGRYGFLVRNQSGLQLVPCELEEPVTVQMAEPAFDEKKGGIVLRFDVASHLDAPATGDISVTDGDKREFRLAPREKRRFEFRLPGTLGRRSVGNLAIRLESPLKRQITAGFDTTPVAFPVYPRNREPETEWKRQPPMDFTAWAQPGEIAEKDRSEASAALRMFADPRGIFLRIEVRDARHRQDQGWSDLWRGDSVQFGFDLDATRPWSVNDAANDYQGHRIAAYAAALNQQDGKIRTWCHSPFAGELKSGPGLLLLRAKSTVRRDESKQLTIYDLCIPYPAIGAAGPPRPGERFGFALLVNDDNGAGRRQLPLFYGISTFDPARWGRLLWTAPAK